VEDAAKALESTNGIALDKNGQLLRVAFAKSIGPASAATSQGSAAAAAAIEAATFAQQVYSFLPFCGYCYFCQNMILAMYSQTKLARIIAACCYVV
jgi:hypothetical protein